MAIVSATIKVASKNFNYIMTPTPSQHFSLKLIPDKEYDIALDQSSSCTGIAICSTDNDVAVIIEVARDTKDKFSFYRDVRGVLFGLVDKMNIRDITCEEPLPIKNKRYSTAVLLELRGRVSDWIETKDELSNARFDSIYPQTWKTLVIDKTKGKNRFNSKQCIADDICDIFPEFRKYMNIYSHKDYDGFDAMGILLGHRRYAYTDEGIPLICGRVEKKHRSFVGYKYVPASAIQDGTLHDFFGKQVYEVFAPKFLYYNERYNKFENIRMATSNHDCSYTIMPNEIVQILRWQFDLEIKDDHVLVAYMFNKGHYPQATHTALKCYFPMNEEVTTC